MRIVLDRMGAPNIDLIRPMFQVVAWTLVSFVGVASAVLVLFYGGLPGLVVFLLVLLAGGLWWWQAAEESVEDGGRRERPRGD